MQQSNRSAQPIRVLVVEDSPSVREMLVRLFQTHGLDVIGTAHDGIQAIQMAATLRPDIITMDIHLPRLNGIEATRQIMANTPIPVVVVSASIDEPEHDLAFEALRAGALTVVDKPPGPGHPQHATLAQQLVASVRLMSEVRVVRQRITDLTPIGRDRTTLPAATSNSNTTPQTLPTAVKVRALFPRPQMIAIAASTGGPQTIQTVLRALGSELDIPVLIVQHISPGFVTSMTDWLTATCPIPVQLARSGERPYHGIFVAPDDSHLIVTRSGSLALSKAPVRHGFRPSANVLFESLAESLGALAIGIILTGMGNDGADGLLRLRIAGGTTIAQDEQSSIIYGMPRAAVELNAAQYVLPAHAIGETVWQLLGRKGER